MDSRFYFAAGDLICNLALGALVGLIIGSISLLGMNMWLVMPVAMIAGMILGFVLWFPFSIMLGAMELLVPMMLTGMVSGMVMGMIGTHMLLPLSIMSLLGGFWGLLCINGVWLFNLKLRGVHQYE